MKFTTYYGIILVLFLNMYSFVLCNDNVKQNVETVQDEGSQEAQEEDIDADDVSHPQTQDQTQSEESDEHNYNFYSFTVKDSDGNDVNLDKYVGKVSLVVNVASECGYTDNHYKALNKIHNHFYGTDKFTVLAFPCNQFGRQEPGTNKEIQEFVHSKYNVKFPVFGKINVIDTDVPEAWQFLSQESGTTPNWNFFKYLVTEHGEVVGAWGPWVSVDEIYSTVQEAITNAMRRPHLEL